MRDIPEDLHCSETNAFVGYPRKGVSSVNDIDPQELEPHYFTPYFLRPISEAEEDPEIDSERTYDVSNDVCFTHIICSFRHCI